MTIPNSLRRRLLFYTLFLMTLLIGFLLFFYQSGREAILETADRNTELSALQIKGKLRSRELELERHLRMISENNQLREYMFIVVSIGGDKQPLQNLFTHLYGWVPFDRVILLAPNGDILLGKDDRQFMRELESRNVLTKPIKTKFYLATNKRFDVVNVVPMYYRKQYLGNMVLSYDLGEELIDSVVDAGFGQIFIVTKDAVVRSTLPLLEGTQFKPDGDVFVVNELGYRLQPINLPGTGGGVTKIWFGLSDVDLLRKLNQSQELMLWLAFVTFIIVLFVSYYSFNRFNRPMSYLVSLMGKVGEGALPTVGNISSDDELGYLTNQFKEMVSRLRKQQREIDKVHEQLEQQATTDELTGFYNRRFLYNIYPKLWSEANRQRKTLGIVMADLDNFKLVNDTHGHLVGDEILKQFTSIINQCSRVSDFLVRMGGEEFLILTSEGIESAQVLAEKIRLRLEQTPMQTENELIRITCSFGIAQAEVSDGQKGLSEVLRRADLALYHAKNSGRNRVATFDENLKRA